MMTAKETEIVVAKETETVAAGETSAAGQRVQLGIRLQPVNHSEQPVFSNFTVVQGAPGTVFIDFGFLEPSVMPSVARLARSGGKLPETVNGRLACRMALGLDAAAQLAQQLDQHLRGVREQAQQAAKRKGNGSDPAK